MHDEFIVFHDLMKFFNLYCVNSYTYKSVAGLIKPLARHSKKDHVDFFRSTLGRLHSCFVHNGARRSRASSLLPATLVQYQAL